MRLADSARVALIGIFVILLQLALILSFPGWRTGFEFYVIFLLLLAATRGPLLAGVYALAGGAVMDAYSSNFVIFHILYYLLPVALGSLVRGQMLTEYRLLGSGAVLGLQLAKIWAMFMVAYSLHWLPSMAYVFKAPYLPVLLCALATYVYWPRLTRAMATGTEGARSVR